MNVKEAKRAMEETYNHYLAIRKAIRIAEMEGRTEISDMDIAEADSLAAADTLQDAINRAPD